MGALKEVVEFNKWIGKQPFKHKIVIAGNHEFSFDLEKEATFKSTLKNYPHFVSYI